MRCVGCQNSSIDRPPKLLNSVKLVRDGYEQDDVEENGSDSLKGHPFSSVRRVQRDDFHSAS